MKIISPLYRLRAFNVASQACPLGFVVALPNRGQNDIIYSRETLVEVNDLTTMD